MILNKVAQAVSEKYGLSCENAREFSSRCGLLLFSSRETDSKKNLEDLDQEECAMFIINMLEGAKFNDLLWTEYLKELLKTLPPPSISTSNSSNCDLFNKTNFLVEFLVEKNVEN